MRRPRSVQADTRIIVVGSLPGEGKIIVARLTPDGRIDGSYDGDPTQRPSGFAGSVALAGFQRAVVTGVSGGGPTLWRFTTAGRLDVTFGTRGVATLHIADQASIFAIAVDASKRIVLSGIAGNGNGFIARLHPGGTLDKTFGTNGRTIFTETAGLASVAIQPDGRIVAAGGSNGLTHMAAVRLLASGARDPSFGTNGVTIVQPQGRASSANDIAVAPDGTLSSPASVETRRARRSDRSRSSPACSRTAASTGRSRATEPRGCDSARRAAWCTRLRSPVVSRSSWETATTAT